MATLLGVDVGGTFTDLVWCDDVTGEIVVGKQPTSPSAPERGVVEAVGATLSAALTNVWWQRPGKRTAFRERAPAPWFVTLAELGLALLIALAAGLLAARQAAGLVPAAAAAAILMALRATAGRRDR